MDSRSANEKHQWRPSASLEAIQLRAKLLARLRQYFADQAVLEVETPLLASGTIPDPHIPSFSFQLPVEKGIANNARRYLCTSPEFAMKRLLAAGSGSIYQVCKAFRQGELGRMHNPEFTLVEWYRTGFDHHQLMDDVAALVTKMAVGIRYFEKEERLTYRTLFQKYLDLDPFQANVQQLKECAQNQGIGPVVGLGEEDHNGWLDLLMGQSIQPRMEKDRLTFVFDYPADQAALARLRMGNPTVAERFELFIDGVELANGFHELQDAAEQRRRFGQELIQRQKSGMESVALDEYFLEAMVEGLPDCSGVALGLDRLLAVLTGVSSLEKVMAFPYDHV